MEILPPEVQSHESRTHVLRVANELHNLRHWGFVIYRCTYDSQDKWDTFISNLSDRTEKAMDENTTDLLGTLAWTVVEDPQALEGASIVTTSKMFTTWVEEQDDKEMQDTIFSADWHVCPRFDFFIHASREMVDSVLADEREFADTEWGPKHWMDQREWETEGMNFVLLVNPADILMNDHAWESLENWKGKESRYLTSEVNEEGQYCKLIRGADVFKLYVYLLRSPQHWNSMLRHKEEGYFSSSQL